MHVCRLWPLVVDACNARLVAKNEERDSGVDVSIGVPRARQQGWGGVSELADGWDV